MSHVFLSYSRNDRDHAQQLVDSLISEGLDVWWDDRIGTGANYLDAIQEKLVTAASVIVLWSRSSVESAWVKAEAEIAFKRNRLLPALIEPVDPPWPFNINQTALLHDWRGCRDHLEFRRIIVAVREAASSAAETLIPAHDEVTLLRDALDCAPTAPATALPSANFDLILERLEIASSRLLGADADEGLVRLNGFAAELIRAVRDLPSEIHQLRDFLFDWDTAAQAWLASNPSVPARLMIDENRRCLRQTLKSVNSAGFDETDKELEQLPWLRDAGQWGIDICIKKLTSDDDLQRTDAVDYVAGLSFEKMQPLFAAIEGSPTHLEISKVFWENWPRLRLYHRRICPVLVQLLERMDAATWQRRQATFHLLREVETADEVNLILARAASEDRPVFVESLLVHPFLGCRQFALELVPQEKRWNTLLFRDVHPVIVREIVTQSCRDGDVDYIKVMFLLLLPRLMNESSAAGLREAYAMLSVYYRVPLFLQDTMFSRLLKLRAALGQRIARSPNLRHFEEEIDRGFRDFCSQERIKDVDVTRMTHVPLPIQRMLAHQGHFPGYFICNYRDVIALETVPHVQRRPDVVEFLNLKRINAQALSRLASDKNVMREYMNKLAFCRNPNAGKSTRPLLEHMRFLRRSDLTALSRDKNTSHFAREHAERILRSKV